MPALDRFSVFIFAAGDPPPTPGQVLAAARLADRLGFHSVTLAHHLRVPTSWIYGGLGNRGQLDPLVLLPAMATVTENIRIGTNAAAIPLLPPYEWAKYFATLDVLSKGRVIAGMAMGWFDQDFEAVGVNRRHRGPMFDESLELIPRLWTEDRVNHHGRFYKLQNAELEPKPAQVPYPPIWIGGFLPSVSRAARYGAYLVPGNLTTHQIRTEYVPALQKAPSETGRDTQLCLNVNVDIMDPGQRPSNEKLALLKTAVNFFGEADIDPEEVAIIGAPERCAARLKDYREAGVDHFLLDFQYHGAVSIEYAMLQMKTFVDSVVPLGSA